MNTARVRSVAVLFTAAVTAGVVLTACGGSSGGSSGGSTGGSQGGATGSTITISGFDYGDPLTVAPGTTVTVTNEDSVQHTVTSDQNGQFDSGEVIGGNSATFTAPSADGTYNFFCRDHPDSMHGKLIVAG